MCCALAGGCGGAAVRHGATTRARPARVAERAGAAARAAADRLLGGTTLRIASADPSDLECVLSRGEVRVDVVAQTTPLAWTEYDTTVVHQAQAYGPGTVHRQAELPQAVSGVGTAAEWIPARGELVAMRGTPSAGGVYLTVTTTRSGVGRPASRRLDRAVAQATLAGVPR